MVSEESKEIRHKLKNYLMGIKAFADLIRMNLKSSQNKEVNDYLNKIDKKIDEATDYINKEVV